jgi:hypothetical protein
LKKARQEKKVKRYLEDNFQNREGRIYLKGYPRIRVSDPDPYLDPDPHESALI